MEDKSVSKSLKEYARGIVGGLLFSFPLLYTMEMWWAGSTLLPWQLLALILVTFGLLLGYNRYSGMRPGVAWKHVFIDSIEELGIGLVLSFLLLLLLNRINFTAHSIFEITGKVLLEAMAISIGVSIGTAQLGDSVDEGENGEKEEPNQTQNYQTGKVSLIVLAICGSVVVGGNVAPTDEIKILAASTMPFHHLGMAILSLLLSLAVTYMLIFGVPDNHWLLQICAMSFLILA